MVCPSENFHAMRLIFDTNCSYCVGTWPTKIQVSNILLLPIIRQGSNEGKNQLLTPCLNYQISIIAIVCVPINGNSSYYWSPCLHIN